MTRRSARGGGPGLAERLCALGYLELFHRQDGAAMDALWGEPGAPERLAALALDPAGPAEARFLAAEIVSEKGSDLPAAGEKAVLAAVYAGALAGGHARWANAWGIPGVAPAGAGRRLVALGEAAVPALAALLDDETPVTYSGSQEATLGNGYRFRVKDLALYFLREIRGEPLDVREEPAERDRQIRAMRAALREPGTGGGTT